MESRAVSQLSDHVLVRDTHTLVSAGRANTVALLVHLGEIEARRLYARRYDSMHAWCVGELRFSRDAAYRRVRAANAARRFPVLLAAIADGRLHLTAVRLLAPYLAPDNVDELAAAATHQDREAIELLLAHRFPRPDVPTELRPIVPPASVGALALVAASAKVGGTTPEGAPTGPLSEQSVTEPSGIVAPAQHESSVATALLPIPMTSAPYLQLTPLSPGRFLLKGTLDEETVELLRRAQALLGHTLPSRDRVQVLKRVLNDWVRAAERRRYGLTDKPRARRKRPANERTIPSAIKRAVMKHDGGVCAFVGDDGQRCGSRDFLEFDHITPLARGGLTTASNLRLLCRTHNQYEAERVLGRGLMNGKREAARLRADARRFTAGAGGSLVKPNGSATKTGDGQSESTTAP